MGLQYVEIIGYNNKKSPAAQPHTIFPEIFIECPEVFHEERKGKGGKYDVRNTKQEVYKREFSISKVQVSGSLPDHSVLLDSNFSSRVETVVLQMN